MGKRGKQRRLKEREKRAPDPTMLPRLRRAIAHADAFRGRLEVIRVLGFDPGSPSDEEIDDLTDVLTELRARAEAS